jgi:hypothetical protein
MTWVFNCHVPTGNCMAAIIFFKSDAALRRHIIGGFHLSSSEAVK